MIGRVAVAVLLAMQAFYSAAATPDDWDEPDAIFGADQRNWGAPALIVRPDYPAEALAKNITGAVDVTGVITRRGNLDDISYAVERDESLVFVPALKEVAQFWRFHAAPAKDCLPGSKRIMTRVWFEIENGKPKISVSRGYERKDPAMAGPSEPRRADMVPVQRQEPAFPKRMILNMPRSLSEAWVYARLEIGIGGEVTKVVAQGYPQIANELRDFEKSTEFALSKWEFPPASEDHKRRRVACYEIVYRLTD